MKTIVWDVDDVLNDLMRKWFEEWQGDHPSCAVRYDDLMLNPPHKALGIAIDEYFQSLDTFRHSRSYKDMLPVDEVMDWFIHKGSRFHHSVLTAVPLNAASASAQWVFRNFGGWIRSFHFVPSKRKGEDMPEYDKDKAEFLKRLGAVDLFIDDNALNIEGARLVGFKTLLFPRPWNENASSIGDVLNEIEGLIS